ncbi:MULTISPECIES: TRAM domain-containing protein [Saliphagus]|uniref:TRAM domain-containing protein n=1 Tax=Saliphagus infecundisoli TaxID=1849069 RepID=A0ABD5QEY0_9EURY|nr:MULTISPECIES: TRAM domain-containing protein [Saliphagus]
MEISEQLSCLYTAEIDAKGDSYVIEVPAHEIELGDVEPGKVYRVGLFTPERAESTVETAGDDRPRSGPPVETGEQRTVEIETIGDQGDGIARVERGYVVIVPEGEEGDRVEIEIEQVRENVAFARIV